MRRPAASSCAICSQHDDGGWLQDPALLDRLVIEKLQAEAETIARRGLEVDRGRADFPYGHTAGLRRLDGETVDLTDEERASLDALQGRVRPRSRQQYADADELPDEVDQRLGEIETALAAFDDRPVVYDPAEIARAGVFVSIDGEGGLRIERGYVRPEDEAPVEPSRAGGDDDAPAAGKPNGAVQRAVITIGGGAVRAGDRSRRRTTASSRCRIGS